MFRSSSFLKRTVWTPEMALTTVDLPWATWPMVPVVEVRGDVFLRGKEAEEEERGGRGRGRRRKRRREVEEEEEEEEVEEEEVVGERQKSGGRSILLVRLPARSVLSFSRSLAPSLSRSLSLSPMLIVAWREMTSGDSGVSLETSSVERSCGEFFSEKEREELSV